MSIFERLKSGETVSFSDSDYPKVGEACSHTRELLVKANGEHELQEIRRLLSLVFDPCLTTLPFSYRFIPITEEISVSDRTCSSIMPVQCWIWAESLLKMM